MKQILLQVSLVLLGLCLISANVMPVPGINTPEDSAQSIISSPLPTPEVKTKKPGFFQRIAMKIMIKKLKKHHGSISDTDKADRMANHALLFGILGLSFALIPWYTILLAIPFGLLAIFMGNNAKKSGTHKIANANIGSGLGIAALVLFVIWLVVDLIAWVAFTNAL